MDDSILSGDLRLSAHVAVPNPPLPSLGLVLCHGLPNPPRGAASVGVTYPDLADHIAHEAGWTVLTFNFRGTGTSEGDFSAAGWLDDLRSAVRVLHSRRDVRGVWVAGFGHGGTFAVCEAADDHLVRGVATIGSPSTLRDWAQDPGRLLSHARAMGMVRSEQFPPDATRWVRDIGRVDAVAAASRLDRRPLLVLHGVDDAEVPVADARALADAARPGSELRLVQGAGHRLRHDPRAIATLLGWLARQVPSGPVVDVPADADVDV
jgi:putative redox protein